jgi:hypothetical protein
LIHRRISHAPWVAVIGGLHFEAGPAKKLARSSPKNKPCVVVHTCNPTYQEAEVGGSWSENGPDKSMRPYLKNRLKAKVLRHGLSGRVLV